MEDFLKITLDGKQPDIQNGENKYLKWKWIDEGIIYFKPYKYNDKAIIVSAGIHGNETAPIEIINQICTDLIKGNILLTSSLLVVLGNPYAMRIGKRFVDNDMNRMFCGGRVGLESTQETRRAEKIEQYVHQYIALLPSNTKIYHYDLHTAIRESILPTFALLPFKRENYDSALLESLTEARLNAVVFHNSAGKTFSSYTSDHFGAHSCTLELGKARPFYENNLEEFSATKNMLINFIMGKKSSNLIKERPRYFKVIHSIIKINESFSLNLLESSPNFSVFKKNDIVYQQDGEKYMVESSELSILFPNPNVKLGLRAGILVEEVNYD
jgi:succinylglutamate desuccinylase